MLIKIIIHGWSVTKVRKVNEGVTQGKALNKLLIFLQTVFCFPNSWREKALPLNDWMNDWMNEWLNEIRFVNSFYAISKIKITFGWSLSSIMKSEINGRKKAINYAMCGDKLIKIEQFIWEWKEFWHQLAGPNYDAKNPCRNMKIPKGRKKLLN